VPERGDILEVTIESSGFEGTSIAHFDGIVVFVEGGVQGDIVRARVVRTKKKYIEAKVAEVLSPSPQRTEPRCKYFGTCGGCRWQHVKYESQLVFKQQHVTDALERIGNLRNVNVLPIIGSKETYFYRNKLEFSFGDRQWREHFSPQKNLNVEKDFALGFHIPQRYDKILDIDECHLQSELSNNILRFVKIFSKESGMPIYSSETNSGYWRNLVIREGKNTGDVMVNIVTFEDRPDLMKILSDKLTIEFPEISTIVNNINSRKSNIAIGDVEKVHYGTGMITDSIGSLVFHISANSFFQTNTRQAEILYSIAREYADLKTTDIVYDLYCGTGTISLFISQSVRNVIGIDIVQSSIENARVNAQINGIANCEFFAGDLKDVLVQGLESKSTFPFPDVLIVDPPRSGMHPKVVEQIAAMKVPRVVYISCNPATLARDLALLLPSGYDVEKVQPVDMFPHTYHIECVVKLRRS
jgi:23S rRNA (uracil1939-C5)-methyltransferase